jgi:hypothetical protein
VSEALGRVQSVTQDQAKYTKLMTDLIVQVCFSPCQLSCFVTVCWAQALIKIDEEAVLVCCRQVDVPLVKKVIAVAKQQYVALMQQQCGENVKLTLTVNEGNNRLAL